MGVRTLFAACAAAMACAASANSGVLYSSIPDLNAAPIGDWNATYPYTVAGLFSLTSPEIIGSVDFVADASTDPTYLDITIFADNGGQFGDVFANQGIGAASITVHPTSHSTDILSVTLNNGAPLAAGDYWLRITGYGTGVEGFAGSGSMIQCSDSVNDCTPIPQTMGFDLFSGSYGVPEPATWAMQLLGLFALGTALRLSPRLQSSCRGAPAR